MAQYSDASVHAIFMGCGSVANITHPSLFRLLVVVNVAASMLPSMQCLESRCNHSLPNSNTALCAGEQKWATAWKIAHSQEQLIVYGGCYCCGWRCPHRRLTLMRPFGNW
jgi:hypothetical protein